MNGLKETGETESGRSENFMLLPSRGKEGPYLKAYQDAETGKGQEILLA